jgi:hypothetical protein
MNKKKRMNKGQAALEYLTTYGWAMLAGVIAIGALGYFGFLSPTKLLPSNCNFGPQLECVEYRLVINGANARADLIFRNNFGKPINITAVGNDAAGTTTPALPLTIDAGVKQEIRINLSNPNDYSKGDKREAHITVRFQRADIDGSPTHNITGIVFTIVQDMP